MENSLQKCVQVTFEYLPRVQYENQIPHNKLQGTKINSKDTLHSINLSIPKHMMRSNHLGHWSWICSHLRGTVLPAFRDFQNESREMNS